MLINLTPHELAIHTPSSVVTIAPSGDVTRVSTETRVLPPIEGIPLVARLLGDVEGLPAPQAGVILVVSGLVAGHPSVAGRSDVCSPGELVRDADGRPVGCRGLVAAAGVVA